MTHFSRETISQDIERFYNLKLEPDSVLLYSWAYAFAEYLEQLLETAETNAEAERNEGTLLVLAEGLAALQRLARNPGTNL